MYVKEPTNTSNYVLKTTIFYLLCNEK